MEGGGVTIGSHFGVKKRGKKREKEGGKLAHLTTTQKDIPPPMVYQWCSKVMQKYRIVWPVRMNAQTT